MVVSTSQRAKGVQRLRDFTSRLQAWAWLPMLLIRLLEGLVCVDAGRRTLIADLAGFGTFFVELGIPFPAAMAAGVASGAFGGGIGLMLG
jgi:uncharacterized membrane protein YphA (DoxX/SURF4 family)